MHDYGRAFAGRLRTGDVVLLHGDLGAGKTTLTQGIALGLGVPEAVQSPTFTLVGEHQGSSLKLYHLDLYRLDDPSDLDSFGYETYIDPEDGITVIEWPERAGDWLPEAFWLISISHLGGDRRHLSIRKVTGRD
jgi:tRNA threonylcarbamoyladenosine biosynthesis protein TsaE